MQSLCTLWQRLGRAARDPCKEATGFYMVEPQYTDKKRKEAEKRASGRTDIRTLSFLFLRFLGPEKP